MDFVKMQGLGNDFVVLEGPRNVHPGLVARLCDRRRGIGADGLLVATPVSGDRIRMEYWNADGSPAETCGNGLRCVARLAFDRGWVTAPEFAVETEVGERRVEVGDELVRAELGEFEVAEEDLTIDGRKVRAARVGNPHAVVLVEDPTDEPVAELGSRIGHDAAFPEGANVEFVTVREPGMLELRVWERGVGETLACGTGAGAAVAVANRLGLVNERALARLPGGELSVEVRDGLAWIEGPAEYVFAGTWDD